MTRQTPPERRLGAAMLLIAAVSLVVALVLVLTGSAPALGGPGRLALCFCAFMAGIEPRRHRPYALPVIIGALCGAALSAGAGAWGFALFDGAVGFGGLWLSESARRSVNGAVLRGGPPIG